MLRLSLFFALGLAGVSPAAEPDVVTDAVHRLTSADPAWSDFAAAFAHKPDATADFSERRFFPFKRTPVELKGEARVAAARGLSLHYTEPEERTVILDSAGVLVRQRAGDSAPPPDPRANAANAALVHVLRFDLPALTDSFEVYGQRDGNAWAIALVPLATEVRRLVDRIVVAGEGVAVHRIEIRHSAKQYVEILVGPSRPAPFTAEELKRFFR